MKLYEITEDLMIIEELCESVIDEETGEIKDEQELEVVCDIEKELEDMLSKKSESIVKYIKNLESDVTSVKDEIKRLRNIQSQREKKIEWLKGYILQSMLQLGYKKIETPFGNISTRKSKSVILDESLLKKDERYWTQKIEDRFDKNTIKKLIQSGEEIDGAMIQENVSLNIK